MTTQNPAEIVASAVWNLAHSLKRWIIAQQCHAVIRRSL